MLIKKTFTFNKICLTCYCISKITICNQKVVTNVTFVTAYNSTITFTEQIIEQVFNNNQFSIEDLLWEREKYWQAQLFTKLYGINNINGLYIMKRKDCQK